MSGETSVIVSSGSYQIEPLNSQNWLVWKCKMQAILHDIGLEDLILKGPPKVADEKRMTDEEKQVRAEWMMKDSKARTQIELAVGDSKMIHLLGADTAKMMWDQLRTIKESCRKLGILAARHVLFRAVASDNFNMMEHITQLKRMQEELHLMGVGKAAAQYWLS